jgi:hypothetical protein
MLAPRFLLAVQRCFAMSEKKSPGEASAKLLTSSARQMAAREYLLEVTRELVQGLRAVLARDDDPALNAVVNQRQRYIAALYEVAFFLNKIGDDDLPEIGKYFGRLAIALRDLDEGVTDPLFVSARGKRDATRIWGARLQAVLGLECFIHAGLSRKKAAERAAKDYPELAVLKRGQARDLEGSLLSWRELFLAPGDGVPVSTLREIFKSRYDELEGLSREESMKRGREWIANAVTAAKW